MYTFSYLTTLTPSVPSLKKNALILLKSVIFKHWLLRHEIWYAYRNLRSSKIYSLRHGHFQPIFNDKILRKITIYWPFLQYEVDKKLKMLKNL